MKKRYLYPAIFMLAGTIAGCAAKTAPVETETTVSEETAMTQAGKQEDAYVYTKLDLPYADFYYGELNDILPEEDVYNLKADLETADVITSKGLREDGFYDGVSSPTNKKAENFKAAYHTVSGESSEIAGVVNVNVAISKSLYEDAKKAVAENKESKNPLLDFVKEIKETTEIKPADYKVLNSDGIFSKTIGNVKKDEAATAEILSTSNYGQYQINIKDNEELDPDTVLGAIIETEAGKKYGLKHLDNIWTKPVELAFSASAFTDVGHNADKEFARFSDLEGQTISKITYLIADNDDIEIDTSLFVKYLAPKEYSLSGDETAAYSKDGYKINYELQSGDTEYKLVQAIYRRKALDLSSEEMNSISLSKDYLPGQYQFIFSNDKYTDLSFKVLVESELKAEDFSFKDNKLSLKENANGLTVKDYINSTNSATVGEKEYKGGRGRKFGTTVFNEDGSIKLDATLKNDSGEEAIFEGEGKIPVTIKADGYPDISFEVSK